MPGNDSHHLKWKGQKSGPFSLEEIEGRLQRREISVLHEIEHQGRWMTLRAFLAQRAEVARGEAITVEGAAATPKLGASASPPLPFVPEETGAAKQATPRGIKPSEPSFYVHAGFALRAVAAMIDLMPPVLLMWAAFRAGLIAGPFSLQSLLLPPGLFWLLGVLALCVPVAALLESSPLQGTPGKWALGIVVTDRHGNQLLFAASMKRAMLKFVGGLPFGFGWFMAAFNREGRSLHDVLAETSVVFRVTSSTLLR